jgi:hypothetical protein
MVVTLVCWYQHTTEPDAASDAGIAAARRPGDSLARHRADRSHHLLHPGVPAKLVPHRFDAEVRERGDPHGQRPLQPADGFIDLAKRAITIASPSGGT